MADCEAAHGTILLRDVIFPRQLENQIGKQVGSRSCRTRRSRRCYTVCGKYTLITITNPGNKEPDCERPLWRVWVLQVHSEQGRTLQRPTICARRNSIEISDYRRTFPSTSHLDPNTNFPIYFIFAAHSQSFSFAPLTCLSSPTFFKTCS